AVADVSGLCRQRGVEGACQMRVPMLDVINGGAHASTNVRLQELMSIPAGAPSCSEAMRYGVEIFQHLKQTLAGRGMCTAVGDEGGFAPDLPSNAAALDTLIEAIEAAGYTPGEDVWLRLDARSEERRVVEERGIGALC